VGVRLRWRAGVARAALLGAQCVVWALIGVFAVPFPRARLDEALTPSLQVLDRDGRLLRHVPRADGTRCVPVPSDAISPWVVAATLAGEDHHFAQHPGVDPIALVRATRLAFEHGRIYSGASTLTMQLVRLVAPVEHRGAGSKVGEMVLALRLEAALSKAEILNAYLNLAPYGHGQRGIEAAARYYWGRPASSLTLGQAVTLAVLPRGPSHYDPYAHPERLRRRRAHLLGLMLERGVIEREAYEAAVDAPLPTRGPCASGAVCPGGPAPFEAPHFVDHVLRVAPPGRRGTLATTLDLDLQRRVEAAVRRHGEPGEDPAVQVAVVVVDNGTDEVRAMVGSRDFFGADAGQVNGALAARQPGSTLKPFVYGLAFERGQSPATVVPDVATAFDLGGGQLWQPTNFDGRFRGAVSARDALAGSLNVAAVRVLGEVGVGALLEALRKAGLAHLDEDAGHYGLGLALGDGEATLVELVGAYAALARGGRYRPVRVLRGEARGEGVRVLGAEAAFMVSDVLSDELARGRAFGFGTALRFPWPVAVKTGTSGGYRDAWTVGYTGAVTVGVWVGRFDGAPVPGQTGTRTAGPLFAEVLREAVEGRAPGLLPAPAGIARQNVCALSGMAPGTACPHRRSEWFALGAALAHPCDWHVTRRVDRTNGLLAGPTCAESETEERAFVAWPEALRDWAAAHDQPALPVRTSPRCPTGGRAGGITLLEPPDGATYLLDPSRPVAWQTIRWVAAVEQAHAAVHWTLDGAPVEPTRLLRTDDRVEGRWALEQGRHRLKVELVDGGRDAVEFEVR